MSLFCYKCGQQLPEDAHFCMKCGTAVIGDTPGQKVEDELSTDEITQFENEVWLLDEVATKGTVTQESINRALALFEKLDRTQSPALFAHPQLKKMQEVLRCYQSVAYAMQSLRNRWQDAYGEDRKKGYVSSTQGQLIVGDYKVFAEKGVNELIDGLINGKEQINIFLGV
jgi:hypothetical protein